MIFFNSKLFHGYTSIYQPKNSSYQSSIHLHPKLGGLCLISYENTIPIYHGSKMDNPLITMQISRGKRLTKVTTKFQSSMARGRNKNSPAQH